MDSSGKKLLFSLIIGPLIFIVGTTGYMVIEGWDLLDAVYMTVTTLSTVGYGEVHKMSAIGRVYTVLLVLFGTAFFLYVAGSMVQFMVEGRIRTILGRKRLDKRIDHLKDHYIVCGYGRIGKVLCKNLKRAPIELIVIDNNQELFSSIEEKDFFYLMGDATDEATLLKAGIKKAKGLIAVLATDADNVFLVLTARQLNPDIFIMARAGQES